MPLDPSIAVLLQFIEASGQPRMSDGTPEQARQALRALLVDYRDPSTTVEVGSVEPASLAEGMADEIPARVYRPPAGDAADADPVATVVYLHGGGFVIGDLDTHDNVCRRLCRDTGTVVVSVDYPLAPENPFPAAVDAVYAALSWIAVHVDEFGGDATRVVVGGDSAGANLAAVCAQLAHRDGLPLAAQLLVYPAVDLLGDYPSRTKNAEGYFLTLADLEWFAAQYTGFTGGAEAAATDPAAQQLAGDPRLSPLRAGSLAGLAPAIVATAEFDPLRDEGDAYAAALEAAGVPVWHRRFDGLIHGFYGLEHLSPGADRATAWINDAVRESLVRS